MSITFSARLALVSALVVSLGGPAASQILSKDRISRPLDLTQVAAVKGTAHPLARPEFDRGRVGSDLVINGAVVFRLTPAQQTDLDRLLRDLQNPSSPSYHHWLTPEQFADRFGMTGNDLAKTGAWLRSQGLMVTGSSRGRTELYFSGQAGAVERSFRTELHRYVVKGQEHFANATAISVPQAFADVVLSVRGLDDFRPKPRLRRAMEGASPRFTSDISGNHFLNPKDFAVIYNLPAGLDGTGVKIAVTGQTPLASSGNDTSDLDAFRSASGLAAKEPTFVTVGVAPKFDSGNAVEADLDLEWSNAVAPNADVVFVEANSAFDALTHAVNQGLGFAQIISNSFGLCETDIGQSTANSLWQTVRQASAQGQTITSASGDAGAADCDGDLATTPTSATKGLSVDVPAAIPEVTGIGGTEFTGDASKCANGACPTTTPCPNGSAPDDPPFWLGACDLTSPDATAEQYIPEMAWNDTKVAGDLSAGGGGTSTFFSKPDWQAGAGVPDDGARDVPDLALNASPVHDPYLICSGGQCVNGFRNPNDTQVPNSLDTVGGTSAGAPTFAGILALVLQASHGTGLGNVNPMLYSLAASSSAFHDITSGDNKVPCTAGSKNCTAGTTSIGFSAGAGYDFASGLGSVDVSALESAWLAALASPAADFQMDGQSATVVSGQTGTATLNVTAVNGFADTVNLVCTPSAAAAAAHVSCSLNPNSVALSATVKTDSAMLSVSTVAALDERQVPHPGGLWLAASGGLFAAVLIGGVPSRRRWAGLLSLILIATAIGAVGCGGGGGGTPQQRVQTGPKTYVISVTGTGANTSVTHTASVSVTVE